MEEFAKKYGFSKIAEIDEILNVNDPDVNDLNVYNNNIPVDLQAYVYKKSIEINGETSNLI